MPRNQWTLAWMTVTDSVLWVKKAVFSCWTVSWLLSIEEEAPSPPLTSFVGQLCCVCGVQTGQHQAEPSLHLRPRLWLWLRQSHSDTSPVTRPLLLSTGAGTHVVHQSPLCWPQHGWGRGVHGGTIMNQSSLCWYDYNLMKWILKSKRSKWATILVAPYQVPLLSHKANSYTDYGKISSLPHAA